MVCSNIFFDIVFFNKITVPKSLLIKSMCSCNSTLIIHCDQMYTEFAEAMEEMGTCLLEKTALDCDDDDSGESSEFISTYYLETCIPGFILSSLCSKGHFLINKANSVMFHVTVFFSSSKLPDPS